MGPAGGSAPGAADSNLTMDDVNIVGRDMKGGGTSKGGGASQGSGGGAPPTGATSGKGEAVFSGSLAKAKLQESMDQSGAGGKIEGGGIGAAAGAFGKFQPGGGVQAEMGALDGGMKLDGKLDGKLEGGGQIPPGGGGQVPPGAGD